MLAAVFATAMMAQSPAIRYWVACDLPGYNGAQVASLVAEAAALWSMADVSIVPASHLTLANLLIVPCDDSMYGWTDRAGPGHFRSGGRAFMRLSRRYRHRRDIAVSMIAHEFGHALGLDHGPDGSIMEWRNTGVMTLSPHDVAAVCGLWGWRRAARVVVASPRPTSPRVVVPPNPPGAPVAWFDDPPVAHD